MSKLFTEDEVKEKISQAIKEASLELPYAVGRVIEELDKDKSEGSYYYAWQANIAMAFQDTYREVFGESGVMRPIINKVSNDAAKRFLNLLCHKPTPEPQ